MLNRKRGWSAGLLAIVLAFLIMGCAGAPGNTPGDPYTFVEGRYRVGLTTTPSPLQAGQPATLLVTVHDATSGEVPTNVTVRPIIDMEMADGMGMTIFDLDTQAVEPGLFHITTMFEHASDITLSLTLDTPDGLVSIRFPSMAVVP